MTRVALMVLMCTVFAPTALPGQHDPSPYAGEERRDIKALSDREVAAYLAGDGFGFALAAELNHYPGPRHVLDLADSLALTPAQRAEIERIQERMRRRATALGAELIERERDLDRLFATNVITGARLDVLLGEIAALQGRIRGTHLHAHLETRHVLTAAQVHRYDTLRGYGAGAHEHPRQ